MKKSIGIDPGATTGIAIINDEPRILELASYKWQDYGAYGIWLEIRRRAISIAQCAEADLKKYFKISVECPTGGSYNKAVSQSWKYARGVGMNLERSAELIRLFKRFGFQVKSITPKRGWTKWKADKFNAYFKYEGKSNEHNRDAVLHAVRGLE